MSNTARKQKSGRAEIPLRLTFGGGFALSIITGSRHHKVTKWQASTRGMLIRADAFPPLPPTKIPSF